MKRKLSIALVVGAALAVVLWVGKGLADNESEFQERRLRMVTRQLRRRGIKDAKVLEAMSIVPRHRFVPRHLVSRAYDDGPQPIGYGQTISQPYIVALMTELLRTGPEDRVLEVGTGSGYQAAVLAQIVREVYTIEIIKPLGESAEKRLKKLKYDNVKVKIADGYHGWPEHAPFDAIIVTAAATDIPPPLIEQLKPGGRMAIPVGSPDQVQMLKLLTKNEEGPPTVRNITAVRFVPLTGGH